MRSIGTNGATSREGMEQIKLPLPAWFFVHPYINLHVQFFKEQSHYLQSDSIIHFEKA